MRTTTMKISEAALFSNAQAIRQSIPQNVKMMCVVKADAYGHGAVQAARIMQRAGADAFAVAIVDEAAQLRRAGINLPILILGGGDANSLQEGVALDVSQAVYSADMLDVLERAAQQLGCRASAHLKIDTGMSRIGVRNERVLDDLLTHWKRNCPNVAMDGIFTHFCVAESDPDFTAQQNERFAQALAQARNAGFAPLAHAAATSAMMNPAYQYDMVRVGIGLYGTCLPQLAEKIEYAQTLFARPTRMETIGAGESVGYGRTFTARRLSRIMTVPIGYGDGYPRILSNRACALVEGRRAPIVGNVCMDMLMLDVTDIPEANLNSEVVLLGSQGKERITPDELAELAQTIPYEIMLGFAARVHRVYEKMENGA